MSWLQATRIVNLTLLIHHIVLTSSSQFTAWRDSLLVPLDSFKPADCECGKLTRKIQEERLASVKVAGGRVPWLAQLVTEGDLQWNAREDYDDYRPCFGTLVSLSSIVFPASCIITHGMGGAKLKVKLLGGDSNKEQIKSISRIRVHPGFRGKYDNDIAVVSLQQAINFNQTGIVPACLPEPPRHIYELAVTHDGGEDWSSRSDEHSRGRPSRPPDSRPRPTNQPPSNPQTRPPYRPSPTPGTTRRTTVRTTYRPDEDYPSTTTQSYIFRTTTRSKTFRTTTQSHTFPTTTTSYTFRTSTRRNTLRTTTRRHAFPTTTTSYTFRTTTRRILPPVSGGGGGVSRPNSPSIRSTARPATPLETIPAQLPSNQSYTIENAVIRTWFYKKSSGYPDVQHFGQFGIQKITPSQCHRIFPEMLRSKVTCIQYKGIKEITRQNPYFFMELELGMPLITSYTTTKGKPKSTKYFLSGLRSPGYALLPALLSRENVIPLLGINDYVPWIKENSHGGHFCRS